MPGCAAPRAWPIVKTASCAAGVMSGCGCSAISASERSGRVVHAETRRRGDAELLGTRLSSAIPFDVNPEPGLRYRAGGWSERYTSASPRLRVNHSCLTRRAAILWHQCPGERDQQAAKHRAAHGHFAFGRLDQVLNDGKPVF